METFRALNCLLSKTRATYTAAHNAVPHKVVRVLLAGFRGDHDAAVLDGGAQGRHRRTEL